MSNKSTDWKTGIFTLVMMILMPVVLILATTSFYKSYSSIIIFISVLIILYIIGFRYAKKIHKLQKKSKELNLQNKSIEQLQEILDKYNEEYKTTSITKHQDTNELSDFDEVTKDNIHRRIKIEDEGLASIKKVINYEIRKIKKQDKKAQRIEKDTPNKNMTYTIITAIIIFVISMAMSIFILKEITKHDIEVSMSVQAILMITPFILSLLGYPIQRMIRLGKISKK